MDLFGDCERFDRKSIFSGCRRYETRWDVLENIGSLCVGGFILGGHALSFVLLKLGCSGGLTLWIVLPLRALLTPEAAPYLGNLILSNRVDVGASSSAGGVSEAPLSISDLAKPVNTSSTDPS
uniref:Uncharacterized protein n=1 Tax=Quercus lobata TaxID=97700 RepID=A0A7N2L9P8_QUELO